LRVLHVASARVDLARVHPSWYVRALLEESPAVQRFVTASVSPSLRATLQAGLLLDSQDLVSERPAPPDVASWVKALWCERLVGGEPERADDLPPIIALTRLTLRDGYRLCHTAGLCKLILAGDKRPSGLRPRQQVRWQSLGESLAATEDSAREQAVRDIQTSGSSKLPARRLAARIGLVTIARLLSDAQPFRLRWALQHWPYPIAKLIRAMIPRATSPDRLLVQWETLILKTAWHRLNVEGKLGPTWPGPWREGGGQAK
jgi:hypothetical protein